MTIKKSRCEPLLSIFVCAYNEEDHIENCLNSIADAIKRIAEKDQIDVFVIDNSSEDKTGTIAKQYCDNTKIFSYVKIKHCILPVSRNSSILLSNARYISFVDADGYVEKDWVKNLVSTLKSENPDIVSGPVKEADTNKPNSLFDLYFEPPQRMTPKYLIGANMTFRREYFIEAGGALSFFKFRGDEAGILINLTRKYGNLKHHFSKKIVTYNHFSHDLGTFYRAIIQDGRNSYYVSLFSRPLWLHSLNCIYRTSIMVWLILSLLSLIVDPILFSISISCLFLVKVLLVRNYYIQSTLALFRDPSFQKCAHYFGLLLFPIAFDVGFCESFMKRRKFNFEDISETETPEVLSVHSARRD
jgi:glycosyltransferase involved in cell wall biosynthesis